MYRGNYFDYVCDFAGNVNQYLMDHCDDCGRAEESACLTDQFPAPDMVARVCVLCMEG